MAEPKPSILDVLPMVRKYRAMPGNCVGGNLYIVLSDGNIRDGDVQFCLEQARDVNDVAGVHIAEMLLRMSMTQRRKICRESRVRPDRGQRPLPPQEAEGT